MDANDFLAKIKANNNEKDWNDLAKVYKDYKLISSKLGTKDRGSLSLNVLCLLCRNLDKAPSWRDSIDAKELLTLTIDCIRETRGMNKAEQVKTLACIYNIHRYVVRKNAQIPPELILKLSFMAFEVESKNLLKEYYKTYWNIIADRLVYIEKLKGKAIHKLLPKLTEDILKTLDIYDTVQFCTNILVFLVKKMHFMYSEQYSEQLNGFYLEIFEKLSKKPDLGSFKKLKDKELLDLYVKFSDCLYVIAENSSKNRFKDSCLTVVVRTGLSLLGHSPDIFHCLQTFYLNSFCDIFVNKTTYTDTIFKNLAVSCEMTEKLGYKTTMVATYPFIGQFLRLFIEYSINNSIKTNFVQQIQEQCLTFMLKLIEQLKNCDQLLKCENCKVKSGLHDALRLSFLLKHFITNAVQNNSDLNVLLPLYNSIIHKQYETMSILNKLGCINYEKCYRKLQTDTHNTAILLNKNKKYEFSINLFEIYIKNELSNNQIEFERKNVARAFYNKSICELDYSKHENALLDAYLSLVFARELSSDKYMSLVMDIKAKALKLDEKNDDDDEEKNDDLQLLSVLDACRIAVEKNLYGDLKPFLNDVEFSVLLKHEFTMYCKLWPSIVPVAGVWQSLHSLMINGYEKWMAVENSDTVLWQLLEVVSLTPAAVRTIHSEYFKTIVDALLERLDNIPEPISSDYRLAQTILLCLKTEYDIAEASTKYGWKVTETSIDPDITQAQRSLSQEHTALQRATQAVEICTELSAVVDTVTQKSLLLPLLHLSQVLVQLLLQCRRDAHALQLAQCCCHIAAHVGDKVLHNSLLQCCYSAAAVPPRCTCAAAGAVLLSHRCTCGAQVSVSVCYSAARLPATVLLQCCCSAAAMHMRCSWRSAAVTSLHMWGTSKCLCLLQCCTTPCYSAATVLLQCRRDAHALQLAQCCCHIAAHVGTSKCLCLLQCCTTPCYSAATVLLQCRRDAHALQLAQCCCHIAAHVGDKETYLRNAGVLLSHIDRATPKLQDILAQAIQYYPTVVQDDSSLETAVVFICEAAIYYSKTGSVGVAAKLVQLAQTRILKAYEKTPDVNLDLAVGRLLEAQSILCNDTGITTLSAVNNIQRHYLSISNTSSKWLPRRLRSLAQKYHISVASSNAVSTCRALQLWRRSRSACAVGVAASAAVMHAAMYAGIVNVHKMDDAQVKIDNRLKYILGLPPSTDQLLTTTEQKVPTFAPKQDFETMLECQTFKSQVSPTRKYVSIPGFQTPDFFRHKSCNCFACVDPYYALISYVTSGLEASMYFRANELEIAGNYFKGVISTFGFFDAILKSVLKMYSDLDFENYIIDYVKSMFEDQFRRVKLEILIEASFFELKNGNFDAVDDYIVTIHEIAEDLKVDGYLNNEIMNLMIASARVRSVVKKLQFDLEAEFENLKLSPKTKTEGDKTPESKGKLPELSARKVKDEELPKRRKVIKLNLDENSSDEKEIEKPKPRKPVTEFKIPVPVTSKPVLETLTPRTTRKPVITVTDTTKTPKTDKNDKLAEFFTPQSTPEQFFTPLNTIKTYSKSLRKGIVKNLEHEFSTPKTGSEKENAKGLGLPARSGRKEEKDRALRRATSPGKLTDSKTRPRRLRQPKLNDE
ncbi:uncharacterized protein LOC110381409 [Helicoverpa armigera]|uniref:uncharacterized protein LOC110381409 n=1 Tax=Helicoverpa armigera TaxID=29058 RepID=UPI003083ADAC